MEKPNCYECVHRRDASGSHHSSCAHPVAEGHLSFLQLLMLIKTGKTSLNIIGNPHGIKNGWFYWPIDFDPVWLERCDGFTAKTKVPLTGAEPSGII